ncbi:MAG: hypothetical protein JNJ55_14405 [Betaproteobacteria bacterium]|nr:hypothetical protein [Betaproteobacteria bacterium]
MNEPNIVQAFPVKLPTLWRQAFPACLMGAVVGRTLAWMNGAAFSLPNTLPLMVMAAVLVALVYFLQPTLAGPEGVKSMNAWGFRRQIAWADIQSVSFGRYYVLQPSFKLVSKDGATCWIARDSRNLPGLHQMALRHGGPDHPLTKALETPLYAA